MADPTLEQKLEQLSQLKQQVELAKGIRKEYDDLRIDVQYTMLAAGMDKTKPVAGVYALISRTEEVIVEDEDKLFDWLEENVADLDLYMPRKPNMDAIKAKAAEVLETDGELIPGIKMNTRETVNIRAAKK